MIGILKKMIIDMIENEKFWETMFEELDKTSQEDWEQFVKEHNMGGKKMKQYYSTENFNVDNYGDEYLSIAVTLNKCAVNNIVVIFDKYSLSFDCIEHIVFDCNAQEQLTLYISYEKKSFNTASGKCCCNKTLSMQNESLAKVFQYRKR